MPKKKLKQKKRRYQSYIPSTDKEMKYLTEMAGSIGYKELKKLAKKTDPEI